MCTIQNCRDSAGSTRSSRASVGDREVVAGRVFELLALLDALDEHDPERRSQIHLDMKEAGYEDEAVATVLSRSRRLVVTSGLDAVISAVRRSHPTVPALLTIGSEWRKLGTVGRLTLWRGELAPFARIERCGATGVAAHHLLATPLLRRWCTMRGMSLLVWTVDGDGALKRWLARADVDVVTTNRPVTGLSIRRGLEAQVRAEEPADRRPASA